MVSPRQKLCPKCSKPIPKTWNFHQECGWDSKDVLAKRGEPSPTSGENSTSGVKPTQGAIVNGTPADASIKSAIESVSNATGFTRTEVLEMMKYDSGVGRLVVSVYMDERKKR